MDNVTHTLAAMLLAEAACQARPEGRRGFRVAAYVTSVLANNLPDVDPFYTWITRPRPLGSLLHHRGHTHTLLFAVPFGVLLALAVKRWAVRRYGAFSSPEQNLLLALGAFGPAFHVFMDFGNNYGVHPFWPFYDGWFYGDSIFIVEPLWWAVGLPVLFFAVQTRWVKGLFALLLGAMLALAVSLPFITVGSVTAFVVLVFASAAIGARTSPRLRIAAAWTGCLAVATLFAVGSARARAQVRETTAAAFPSLRVADVVVTPVPANPLCWSALVAGAEGDTYRVVSASVALAPSVTDAGACPYDRRAVPTAPVGPLRAPSQPALRWLWEYRAELAELRGLARDDCRFRALLRFARVPYVTPAGPASPRIAGDLRYDRSPGLDFSDLALTAPIECPRHVPGWTPPRNELFPGF